MSSPAVLTSSLLGAQRPRTLAIPECSSSLGAEAVELAASAGLRLDPWEAFVLEQALGIRDDGKWAAFEVGLVVSRQNGKGSILEARELAGLFLIRERLIIHSAHQFDTSLEAFRRLLGLIEENPDFDRRVQRVSRSHGEEGIELRGGQRIRFRTRTKGGGRGFTSDCLILDEAMILPESAHGALLPTLAARPNPQVWYTGSAVDQYVHEDGVVLARVRERGHTGEDPSLAYFEWSVDAEKPDVLSDHEAGDEISWAEANPGLGIRISAEHISHERRSMDPRTFAVERLGVGDWPDTDPAAGAVIAFDDWVRLTDSESQVDGKVCLSFDVAPDRSWSSIALAGTRSDGRLHVEIERRDRGAGWVVDRLEELLERDDILGVICDESGPAGSLIVKLENRNIEVTTVTAKEHAQACGAFFDAVDGDTLRHLGTPELASAIKGAAKRPLSEAWAWGRLKSTVDISPLVAVTLAHWGAVTIPAHKEPIVLWR